MNIPSPWLYDQAARRYAQEHISLSKNEELQPGQSKSDDVARNENDRAETEEFFGSPNAF
jgi:hypothetical protein